MQIFVAIAMLVASYLISQLTKPKIHREDAKPAIEADITFPQPDEGTPQAVVFGEAWMPNWAVLWHGNYRASPYQDHGTTVGYRYSFTMLMGVSRGPIDEIAEIQVGDRVAYKPEVDGNPPLIGTSSFLINKPNLFGGIPTGSGGIQGHAFFMNGEADQQMPTTIPMMNAGDANTTTVRLDSIMPGPIPGYRDVATILFDGMVSYGQPTPSAWALRVRRALKGWATDVFYPEKAIINVSSGPVVVTNPALSDPTISDDDKRLLARTVTTIQTIKGMNPSHVIYEGITNPDWGRGLPASMLNLASFTDAANQLYDEGLAAATKWDRSGALSDFMQTIIDYCGAVLYPDPTTGLLTFRLIRGDYDVNNIPVLDYTAGLLTITDNATSSGDTAANQIIVGYTSPVTGKKGQVRAQNTALVAAQNGAVFSMTKTYDCCPNADIARKLADRDLKSYSSGLRRLTLSVDRAAWSYVPGTVFKLINATDHKIDEIVLRVGKIEHAGGSSNKITVTCAQDVYALNSTAYVYTIDTPPTWKPPVPSDVTITPAPPLVTNLRLIQAWNGSSFRIGWDRSSDADHYDVQVLAGTPQKVIRFKGNISDGLFTYTLDDMLSDGGKWRTLVVQVRAVGQFSTNVGPWYSITVSNPQIPTLTGVQITEAMRQAFFQCDRPAEGDWAGIVVHVSDTPGFVPSASTLVYDGVDLFVTLTQLANGKLLAAGTDYYLRAAGYDSFGEDSLNYTSETVFSVVANAPDANTIVAGMIKDGALDVSKFARTVQPPLLVNGVPSAYAGSDVILNTQDSLLYRWDASAAKYTSAIPATTVEGMLELANIPQIPTTQLTGQVTAAQISANAIGANQIAAGAITAGKLAANAVTAGTIAVGAVGADQIAAHSISSDKLLVGDMTNQVDDPGFDLGDLRSWTPDTAGVWSVDATTVGLGADGGKGVAVAANIGGAAAASFKLVNTRQMAVSLGDVWYASTQAHVNVADPKVLLYIGVIAYDANGAILSYNLGTGVGATTYGLSSVQYSVVDPRVKTIQPYLTVVNAGGGLTTTKAFFDQCQLLRMSGTTLIQDGAVTTNKIVASAITGDKIAANAITADKIVANSITGDKIAANAITANLLAAGSISADKLMVGFGQNLVVDPGFQNGIGGAYWAAGGNVTWKPSWITIPGLNENVILCQVVSGQGNAYAYSAQIPIAPNTNYMASAYAARSGGDSAVVSVAFYDGGGSLISQPVSASAPGGSPSTLSGYVRVSVNTKAPANAVTARLFVIHYGTNVNDGTYFLRPQLEESLPNQVTPGPWGAGGATIIGPGSIKTGSLSAISANLGSIVAGSLNINNKFIVDSAGNTTIQTGTSGQRTVLVAGQFLAFDPNNVMRVRLGNW